MPLVSKEATRLQAVLETSPVAYSYFDPGDRLRFWNRAYEDLNFRIRPMIKNGALFSDLITELLVRDQIAIPPEEHERWLEQRLAARSRGTTAFRSLTDGRTFLVQERRDEVGGTLGFWVNVSDLFEAGALSGGAMAEPGLRLGEAAAQDLLRNKLQTVLFAFELIVASECCKECTPLLEEGLTAARQIAEQLDKVRAEESADLRSAGQGLSG